MNGIQGKIYLLIAFSLAGTSVVTGSILTEKLSSFAITSFSLLIVLICLLPLYAMKTIQTIKKMTKRDWIMTFCQAIFGNFYFVLFYFLVSD